MQRGMLSHGTGLIVYRDDLEIKKHTVRLPHIKEDMPKTNLRVIKSRVINLLSNNRFGSQKNTAFCDLGYHKLSTISHHIL